MLRKGISLNFKQSYSSFKSTTSLRKPIFDIKGIVANEELYRESILRRGGSQDILNDLSFVIKNRPEELSLIHKINSLKNERTKLGEEMRKTKSDEIRNRLTSIKEETRSLESALESLSERIHNSVENLPNLLDETTPSDPENGEIANFVNCESEENAIELFKHKKPDHKEIGERLNIMDFKTASRISGSSWYYLIGDGALLEQALVQYGLSKARKNGYKMVVPPSIVKSEIVNACGFKPKDQNGEQQVYDLTGDDLSLTGTAEIPLGALHSSTVFQNSQQFPIKYVGVSRSYRAEAGARGKDTKGLYRVHEFTKVELFHFTTPENSKFELEQLKELQLEIIRDLKLSAKFINMPTTDLGAPALKKYDCEAWMPGRGSWGELTSCSNCGDYQSRRLGIRYEDSNKKINYTHTLNGTAIAVPRLIVAIIEQFYDPASESILIPEVLRPFMDGKERISKN